MHEDGQWNIHVSRGARSGTTLWSEGFVSARGAVLKAKKYFDDLESDIADALSVFKDEE